MIQSNQQTSSTQQTSSGSSLEDSARMLKVEGLWVTVPRQTRRESHFSLRDVSVGFPLGRSTALFGNEGSGKSLLLGVLSGQVLPEKGTLSLAGSPINTLKRLKFGYVADWGRFPPDLTLKEWLEVSLQAYGCGPGAHRKEMIAAATEQWGLQKWADSKIGTAPPDRVKALGWAAATLHSPEILIADEPTLGCHGATIAAIETWIRKQQQSGKTFIYASRDPEKTLQWSSGFHVIRNGEIVLSHLQKQSSSSASGILNSRSFQVEISGLDRDQADNWRRNFSLPLWDHFSVRGFLARLLFKAESDASLWLTQAVKNNMVVLTFGAVEAAPQTETIESIRPFFSNASEPSEEKRVM